MEKVKLPRLTPVAHSRTRFRGAEPRTESLSGFCHLSPGLRPGLSGTWAKASLLKNWYPLTIFLIILIAGLIRFYHLLFWYPWDDQARDAIIAMENLRLQKLPLTGAFSSAGPFTFGPYYYYIITLGYLLFPVINAAWLITVISSLAFILVMVLIGCKVGGKLTGVICGFLTALSPMMIKNALTPMPHTYVSLFIALALFVFLKLIKKESWKNSFFLGVFLGLAINLHYQALYAPVLVPILFVLNRKNIKFLPFIATGFILILAPMIIFDLRHDFFNSKNLLDYYLHGQYRFYFPNRWLTYLSDFWPSFWGRATTGEEIIGYPMIGVLGIVTAYQMLKRKVSKEILGSLLVFLALFVLLRYYRGERLDGYLIYFHPFIILFSALLFTWLFRLKKPLVLLFVIPLYLSLKNDFLAIKRTNNLQTFQEMKSQIEQKFPNEKTALYDEGFNTSWCSHSLALLFYKEGKNMANGRPVLVNSGYWKEVYPPVAKGTFGNDTCWVVDLGVGEMPENSWQLKTPEKIYTSTLEWWKNNPQ